jgi:hypothetical protein
MLPPSIPWRAHSSPTRPHAAPRARGNAGLSRRPMAGKNAGRPQCPHCMLRWLTKRLCVCKPQPRQPPILLTTTMRTSPLPTQFTKFNLFQSGIDTNAKKTNPVGSGGCAWSVVCLTVRCLPACPAGEPSWREKRLTGGDVPRSAAMHAMQVLWDDGAAGYLDGMSGQGDTGTQAFCFPESQDGKPACFWPGWCAALERFKIPPQVRPHAALRAGTADGGGRSAPTQTWDCTVQAGRPPRKSAAHNQAQAGLDERLWRLASPQHAHTDP